MNIQPRSIYYIYFLFAKTGMLLYDLLPPLLQNTSSVCVFGEAALILCPINARSHQCNPINDGCPPERHHQAVKGA